MRTFAILTLMLFAIPPRTVSAVDGHIEMSQHRFSRHTGQRFERLVLEFKREGGKGIPSVRVASDGAAGEVSVRVSDVNLKGTIPEAGINDSYMPKSKVLGPISAAADATHGGFVVRAFLKSPQAKIDAFWLENPSRLVIDAFAPNSPRASGVKTTDRAVASRHGKKKLSNNDFVCFPSQSAVGLKVMFQSKGGRPNHNGIPVALDGGTKGTTEGDSVVCYPKTSQVVAAISFDTPDDVATPASLKSEMRSEPKSGTRSEMKSETKPELQAERQEPEDKPMFDSPIQAPAPQAGAKPVLSLGAPANSIHNKSPQSQAFEAPRSLSLPSAEPNPAATSTSPSALAPVQKDTATASTGTTSAPAANGEPARAPTASPNKPSLNLPLSLPSLPQSSAPGGSGTAKLSLPPPQQTSQAPALLPPISK